MRELFRRETIEKLLADGEAWLVTDVLTYVTLVQAVIIVVALGIAALAHKPAKRWFVEQRDRQNASALARIFYQRLATLSLPIAWTLLLSITLLIMDAAAFGDRLVVGAISLLLAWIVIRLAASLIRSRPIARLVAIVAWTVAALNIVGLLDNVIAALDGIAFKVGKLQISLLTVINSVVLMFILVWGALLLSR
ncbi:MAG: hypothetical protein RLT05_09985, partial [Bauldia litoralis]